MQLAQLEAFVVLARQGTMRTAGARLHLSQPALSARIAGLEAELGARLFERTPRGMLLSAAGRALLPQAERALGAVAAGVRLVRDVEEGEEGQLLLGATPIVSAYVVPELIARLRRVHPGVHVVVRTGPAAEVAAHVAAGDLQIGLVPELRDRRLTSVVLYDEEVRVVARPDHPFVQAGPITPARLSDATLVLFDRGSNDYQLTRELLRAAGVTPYSLIEVDNIETARRMVARGIGVALLPSTAVHDAFEADELAPVALVEFPTVRRRIMAVERLVQADWPPLRHLRAVLRSIPEFIPGALAVDGSVDEAAG